MKTNFILLALVASLLLTSESKAQNVYNQTFWNTGCTTAGWVPFLDTNGPPYFNCIPQLEFNGVTNVLNIGDTVIGGTLAIDIAATGGITSQISTGVNAQNSQNSLNISAGSFSNPSTGVNLCTVVSPGINPTFYDSLLSVLGSGDIEYCTGVARPLYIFQMRDNTAARVGALQILDSNSQGPGLEVTTAASTVCPGNFPSGFTYSNRCALLRSDVTAGSSPDPLVVQFRATSEAFFNLNQVWLASGGLTSSVVFLQGNNDGSGNIGTILGSTAGTSTTTIQSPLGGTLMTGLTTGTPADFVCLTSGNVVVLQATACVVSARLFKMNFAPLLDASPVLKLDVEHFQMRPSLTPSRDPNYGHPQVGFIAENVAAVLPDCAVYYDDMKTPKSYRPECITAFLTKVVQDHQKELIRDKIEIYLLALWCALLTGHTLTRKRA